MVSAERAFHTDGAENEKGERREIYRYMKREI